MIFERKVLSKILSLVWEIIPAKPKSGWAQINQVGKIKIFYR